MADDECGSTMAQLRDDLDEAGGAPATPATTWKVREAERPIGGAARKGRTS